MKDAFSKGVAVSLGLLVVLLLLNAGLSFWNIRKLHRDAGWVVHTQEVLANLGEIRAAANRAEVVYWSYAVHGEARFVALHDEATDEAGAKIERVAALTEDNRDQQARIPGLRGHLRGVKRLMARTVAARKKNPADAGWRLALAGQSHDLAGEIRRLVRDMERAEQTLLESRRRRSEATFALALTTGPLAALTGVGAVGLFIWLLRRHLIGRARAAAVVHEQRQLLQATLASIGDAVITTDAVGRVASLNPMAETLTGWSKEAVGRPLQEVFRIVNEQTRLPVENPVEKVLAHGKTVGLANHTILLSKDGAEWPIDDSAAPIRAAAGQVSGVVLVFRDITDRRHAESLLRDSEERFRRLADAMPQIVWVTGADGFPEYSNQRWYDYIGLTAEEPRANDWPTLLHPDDRQRASERWKLAVSTGEPYEIEYRFRSGAGDYRWFLARAVPIRDEAGRIVKWFGTCTDIDEQRRTRDDIRRRSEQLKRLASVAAEINAAHDVPSVLGVATEEARTLIGATRASASLIDDENPARAVDAEFALLVCRANKPMRVARPDEPGSWLAAPLVGRDGRNLGLIQLSDKVEGEFNEDDEAVLVQLAQMASVAIENARLYGELKDADHRKDEFLATLAHELRNPLAPLRNSLEVMKRAGGNAGLLEEARAMMSRQVDQMVRLIDDLLDISRITRNKMELRKARVELVAVIHAAVETSRPLIETNGHELTLTLPSEPVFLDADQTRLAQVFMNLLNNSAKYTEQGGRIWLTAECQSGDVVVRVKDSGVGIPADKLPHIFEMFMQVDRSLERAQGGLGIGLTLVRRLVEMHGGRVEATSAGAGKGSEFIVRLPVALETPVIEPVEGASAGGFSAPKVARRILIVDDNRDSATSLALLLKFTGNEVRTAFDGIEGVEAAEAFRPHVILLDIGLPRLNGYEAANRIRQRPWSRDVVLVAVTGWGQEGDRRRSSAAGFDHHLVKPIDLAALSALLSALGSA